MKRENVDSAGNAVPDIQAIEDDIDPNTPADVSLSNPLGPNSGCGGGQKASNAGQARKGAMGLLFLPLLGRIRRRKPIAPG
jgi:MYXO-CTERM domain-containing protein